MNYENNNSDERLHYCALPDVPQRTFEESISPHRAAIIVAVGNKWVNGTKLRYFFFKDAPFGSDDVQMDMVRDGFKVWEDIGVGIDFEEVDEISEAEVRIGFLQGDGSWSYVGRDVIDIPGQNERTMNFGWDLTTDPRGVDVAVHEIGHTLGFKHEHQNPFSGIEWDEDAVYAYFGGPPNNWLEETTFHNILRKLNPSEVAGSDWDPNSIMHYSFPPRLIVQPEVYFQNGLRPALGLSDIDIEVARRFYPLLSERNYKKLKPFVPRVLSINPGEQDNFVIRPTETRNYTIQTFGFVDTVMVLFEDIDGDLRFVAGDDNSGLSRNAKISARLYRGREYILRVRLYLNYASGHSVVMMH